MGLADFGESILRAFDKMSKETVIDKEVRKRCFGEIRLAFLRSYIEPMFTRDMRAKIKNILINHLNLDDLDAARKMIQQVVFDGLCKLLEPNPPFVPKLRKTSVVMFVGAQGCGKTTTCIQYANYYKKKGLKTGLVCADTFRIGAFDQLKQNATKANIPCYGSYTELDHVKIAVKGVERCKEENCDLIIVDASGGHKQEDALFEEMHQISKATKPDLVILVTDGNIGQDGFDNDSHKQAMAFAQSVDIGAVILTKMDGHAMGGGSLSAVAAAKSPVIFIGTGEHMDEFEVFEVKPFVSCLLGMDDWYEFIDKVYEVPELPQNLPERKVWIPPLAYFPPSLHHLFDSD